MNIYDFDNTIYQGDSTINFYLYCLRKKPVIIRFLPKQLIAFLLHAMKKISTEELKETFFCFLPAIEDPESMIEAFWNRNIQKIRPWYMKGSQSNDLIISASPAFLVGPACKRLNIAEPIATCMDIRTGKIHGINCKGHEKVRRLVEQYGHVQIESFYSDSLSDSPLASMAKHAYLVGKKGIAQWPEA